MTDRSTQFLVSCYPEVHESLTQLGERIGYGFNQQSLLIEALTHRSAITELKHHVTDPQAQRWLAECPWNEKLEFLGDSVLSLSMVTWLWRNSKLTNEGELSKAKSALVQEAVLVLVAQQIHLGSCLLMGAATERDGGRQQESILGDAVEALIGAVYLDGGFEVCYFLIENLFRPFITRHFQHQAFVDHKTRLQEVMQQQFGGLPQYDVVDSSGPDHQKQYTVECRFNAQVLGRGEGKSKKKASQLAAEQALKGLNR